MELQATAYRMIATNYITLTFVEIRLGVKSIVEPLTRAEMKTLGALVGISVSGTKTEMQETFAREVCENKCSYQRCQFTLGSK